jgi:hypothetical protein
MNAKKKDAWTFLLSLGVGFLFVFLLVGMMQQGRQAPAETLGTTVGKKMEDQPGMKLGERPAPSRLTDLEGRAVDPLAPGAGAPGSTILSFTSRRCPKCSDEAAVWKRLAERSGGLRTFVVSLDSDRQEVRRYAEAYELGELSVLYDATENGALGAFNIHVMPQYLVFDPQGRLVHRDLGYWSASYQSEGQRADAILAAARGRPQGAANER